jgi:hypothetical protein
MPAVSLTPHAQSINNSGGPEAFKGNAYQKLANIQPLQKYRNLRGLPKRIGD